MAKSGTRGSLKHFWEKSLGGSSPPAPTVVNKRKDELPMGKFVGFKCDMCGSAEDGNERPSWWIVVRLPSSGDDAVKDICSDKCLLKFAKERTGTVPKENKRAAIPGLREFMIERGFKPQVIGPKLRAHTLSQHASKGAADDCLVCEFEMMREKVAK